MKELTIAGGDWLTRFRVRRIVKNILLLGVSLYLANCWLSVADPRHPISIQKKLFNDLVSYLHNVVMPQITTLVDGFLIVAFVVVPVIIAIGLFWGITGLCYALFSPKASRRFRVPF